jgi:hypothetical protein
VATCFVHHDGGKDGGVQEERLPQRRRNWLVPGETCSLSQVIIHMYR